MSRPSPHNSWCRHRRPFTKVYPVCKVGVDFHQFLGPRPIATQSEMPCLGETARAKARCDQYSGYTSEEIAAAEAEWEDRIARTVTIRKAIMAEHESSGSNGGQIPCPACKTGIVSWSRARINGHVHARCSTDGCASWME